nr:uncharacterized protein LOC116766665 isoform X2 [Danaus plexippus plexippus]
MDIFDGWLDENSPLPPYSTLLARAIQKSQNESNTPAQPQPSPKDKKDLTSAILSKSNMARALKESGYESDSTIVFRRQAAPLSPSERRAAYRDLQAGGEPPRGGFRSPAPNRQDETEIEYIPISPTLTKIRIHKKTPQMHEVICYPITCNPIEQQYLGIRQGCDPKFQKYENDEERAPIPPTRISSRNSQTLKFMTSKTQTSGSPIKLLKEQSNVEFLKDKISNKLNRQNTHIIIKPKSIQNSQRRIMSTSAPPVLNRNKTTCTLPKNNVKTSKPLGTSSFSSERRIIQPINYPTGRSKSGDTSSSVNIEGGVGRRTPITNILDKVTQIDKLWGSQKRNERIDVSKIKPKSIIKSPSKPLSPKTPNLSPRNEGTVTHKSRDMIRTAEKIQNMKVQAKSTPCLAKQYNKSVKSNALQIMSNMSKSSPSIQPLLKKQHPVKTATVTNLKKKKSLESISLKPRHTLTNEQTIKKVKYASNNKKLQRSNKTASKKQQKDLLSERDTCNQFGDNLDKLSNKGSVEFLDQLTSNDLREARNTIVSDSFFQHLFLRDTVIPPNMQNYENVRTSVLQKAKYFQSLPDTNVNFSNSLNTYLVHRKPVSLSRFKLWDSHSNVLPISSSRSISWPGKMDGRIRKFESLTKSSNEFGSSSSLSTVRSKSEPPCSKLYFSQTSRPISPTVTFYKKQESSVKKSPSPVRIFVSHRSLSPNVMNKTQYLEKLSRSPTKIIFSKTKHSDSGPRPNDDDYFSKKPLSEDFDKKTTFFFSEISRPVSPRIRSPHNRSQSTSPAPVRSPSYRRIHNVRAQNKLELTNKKYRTLSADNAVEKKLETKIYCRPKSDSNLNKNDPEYEEYINDIQNATNRSIRFRELNRYYSYLERVAELEKATNNQNSCYRKRDEEIIDFDRWKKIRTIERAEEELDSLYKKLRKAQNENDVLFYPKDVNDLRWNFNKERGLRMKEKSVEDLKEELEQKTSDLDTELDCLHNKDTYKPLWRGTSVAETAFTINRKNEIESKQICNARNTTINSLHDNHLSDLRRKIGLGSRLWSSLSMDQVNALKNQLNAIYSRELETKLENNDNYTITVKDAKTVKQPDLHVRCNSLTSPKTEIIIPEINKSESIAAISCQLSSEKEIKNNVNKMQMSLTETEKKKLSQSLSKELLKRINKFDTPSPKSEPEKQVQVKIDTNKTHESKCSDINHKLNEEIIKPKNDNIRHLIFPVPKQDTSNQSSASETDTLSSDISGKTVIYRGPAKEVQKKVQYFESVKDENEPPVTVHLAKDTVIEKNQHITEPVKKPEKTENKSGYNSIVQSQSCSDLKELFGESEANKFLSLPAQSDLYSRTPSPQSEVHVDRITPDTLRFSSDETIWRSRTPSPDPERYWRAYLKLAREGEVRRLARRFDSPSAAGAVLRRYRSDPEIIRNDIKNNWPTDKAFRRGKCRSLLPVARMPLRPNNRFMPHIDVISKLAALRKRNTARSRSAEEVLECRPGEVERIRRRFEAMSLLGQMYTSTPDVCELQNITSYLAGPWIAHRYPKPEDNKKPIRDSDNNSLRGRTTLNKKDKTKTKGSVNLNSILKSDSLAKQAFNPLVHQPASRYEPPRTPPRPPSAAWPYRLAPYVTPSRHTVTFKEGDTAPEPPRRASQSCSDSESPNRRYIESDVNIHYRCPVRHDPLPLVPERELARQQADHMKRLYREQRRNKYLQELQDMQNRRHQDNFMPSQKTIVPLNRYDEAERIVAKALYTFNGQTSRELSFRKGDIINVRRQIDSNWYEGEVHGKVGLFPYNYVELMKGDGIQTLKKTAIVEGRAKAKFDFTAQTNLELPLKKGEVVVLTRRIDHNWWEGRTGNKTGIFPDSYVTILQEPSQSRQEPEKPVGTPAAHGLMNGDRPTSHRYTPQHNSPALSNAPPATAPLPSQGYIRKSSSTRSADLNNTEPLYVDTNAEAVPYRAMYKYRPQNPDELELLEGETVYVLEKCDDGWYVGSSQRTGRFGTFPGNYVERI